MSIKWGEIRLHNGSAECPAEARDAPCMILEQSRWLGATGARRGSSWKWRNVTAYRLPAHISASPEVRALVDAAKALGKWCVDNINGPETELYDALCALYDALAAFESIPQYPPAADIDDPLSEIAPLPQAEE